jgi:hypothetical protein
MEPLIYSIVPDKMADLVMFRCDDIDTVPVRSGVPTIPAPELRTASNSLSVIQPPRLNTRSGATTLELTKFWTTSGLGAS